MKITIKANIMEIMVNDVANAYNELRILAGPGTKLRTIRPRKHADSPERVSKLFDTQQGLYPSVAATVVHHYAFSRTRSSLWLPTLFMTGRLAAFPKPSFAAKAPL